MISLAKNAFFSLFYPQKCDSCGGFADEFEFGCACRNCWHSTRFFLGTETVCSKCSEYLSETASPKNIRCGRCDDYAFDRAVSCGIYENGLGANILRLKTYPDLSQKLKELITAKFEASNFPRIDLVIPVPLSAQRFMERGFNQASEFAKPICSKFSIPIDESTLKRSKNVVLHRGSMDRKARELSVKKAFEITRPKLIEGKTVLLVDDVMTTGATASACAAALKKKGASGVYVLTAARAI